MVYLNAIQCFLDNKCFSNDLSFLNSDIQKQNKYRDGGIQCHYRTENSSSEMAYWKKQGQQPF